MDQHIRHIERHMGVEINNRSNNFHISGDKVSVQLTKKLLIEMYASTKIERLSTESIHLYLQNMEMVNNYSKEVLMNFQLKQNVA